MLVVGCDLGALTAKAVVLEDGAILGCEIIRSRASADQTAAEVVDGLLARHGISWGDIDCCVGTGYGRKIVPFADQNISEISCHARGARWLMPGVRTVIDGGGQDCKVITLDENGLLADFRMNMKCAAGTGRALELMAQSLGVDVSQLGPLSLKASQPVVLREHCCILAQVEIRRLVFEGRDKADIAAGVNDFAARQIMNLVRDVDVEPEIAITGGIAKNIGVVHCLERALGRKLVHLPEDPQLVGAIGAALFAADRAGKPG
ncbi:MAG: 2-hydroxyglutaryl-CoA dehydratase [Chloroflexi bacterium]|nr:MAG: 2-hydroxyglutaryl-CoA dehydratase [Chloroflexota bacterium]